MSVWGVERGGGGGGGGGNGGGGGQQELNSYRLMRQATQLPPSCANCFSPFLILSLVC